MSKQSEAKAQQGYVPNPTATACMNCENYSSDFEPTAGYGSRIYNKEVNIRCGIGGFAIKKLGRCNCFKPKSKE